MLRSPELSAVLILSFGVSLPDLALCAASNYLPGASQPTTQSFIGHPFFEAQAENFELPFSPLPPLEPGCLKRSGWDLVILDAGHDDSEASMRSDSRIRGGDGRLVFLWPEVHEGQLNWLTAYLAYEIIVGNPALSLSQKNELKSMLRFTRHPGETFYGEFEALEGYGERGGEITSGIENRLERANQMIRFHRPFDPETQTFSKLRVQDVTNRALLLSIHANSSDYYDEDDLTWIIPPFEVNRGPNMEGILTSFQEAFSVSLSDYLRDLPEDTPERSRLKRLPRETVLKENILLKEHWRDLTMLKPEIRTFDKLLLEGFVMNGMIGHLAMLDIRGESQRMRVVTSRKGRHLARYSFSFLYYAYAEAIVRSLLLRTGCL